MIRKEFNCLSTGSQLKSIIRSDILNRDMKVIKDVEKESLTNVKALDLVDKIWVQVHLV